MGTKEHYDQHLGNIYVWMCGAFEEKQIAQQTFFERNQIFPNSSKVAIDLGAAHGFQSVSLAKMGFDVTAVDFNEQLLTVLEANTTNLAVKIVSAELLTFLEHCVLQPELIVCMGDTLPHLESTIQVEKLFAVSAQKLSSRGKLVISFRDLVHELTGTHRFIPVRSDAQRILTCFLEFFPDKVMVHDMLQEREQDGWKQKVSAYAKLRLNEQLVTTMLMKHGFRIVKAETISRMIHVIAEKV
jgi:hypothetical protein